MTDRINHTISETARKVWNSVPIRNVRDTVSDVTFNVKSRAEDIFEPIKFGLQDAKDTVLQLVDATQEKLSLLAPPFNSELPNAIHGQAKAFVYEIAAKALGIAEDFYFGETLRKMTTAEMTGISIQYDEAILAAQVGLYEKVLQQEGAPPEDRARADKDITELKSAALKRRTSQISNMERPLIKAERARQNMEKLSAKSTKLRQEASDARSLMTALVQKAHEQHTNQRA